MASVLGDPGAPFRLSDRVAYPATRACAYSGCSPREVRYWDEIGLVVPSIQATGGLRGKPRLYSAADLLLLREIVSRLFEGESLQSIRKTVPQRRAPSGVELVPPRPKLRIIRTNGSGISFGAPVQAPLVVLASSPVATRQDILEARARIKAEIASGVRKPRTYRDPADPLTDEDAERYRSGEWLYGRKAGRE